MATPQDVIHVAAAQVGYHETGGPHGNDGNITKYWAELDPGLQGQPWCACFVRWNDKHAKAPDLPISNPYYCPNIVTYARQHGLWNTSGQYQEGDIVLFDFSGHGVAEHVGRVVSDDGHYVHTIEGNTSPTDAGSQANGGGVYRKSRPHGPMVMGVLSYHKLLQHAADNGGKPPRNKVKKNPFPQPKKRLKQGDKGTGVKWVQWAVGVPVDGIFGKQTDHAVRQFQFYHQKACGAIDGIVDAKTRAALAKVTN